MLEHNIEALVFARNSWKYISLELTLQILAPLPIGFAVFLVHLATIPITGTGINPARSLGAAIIFNKDHAWDDHVSHYLFSNKQNENKFLYKFICIHSKIDDNLTNV